MQVLIDIPEEDYNEIKEHENFIRRSRNTWKIAVLDGVVLPEKHGRLIDAGELEECKETMNTISGESKDAVRMNAIRNMLTIIEADGGDAE
jgi:hypothetical protein